MSQALVNTIEKKFDDAMRDRNIQLHTQQSLDWFSNYIQRTAKVKETRVGLDSASDISKVASGLYPGNFYLFSYDAKYKATLPYWDALPLVLITHAEKGRFWGINFHYMPPLVRKKIMSAMYVNIKSNRNQTKKLEMNWEIAKAAAAAAGKNKYLKHSIKQYLRSHVDGRVYKIDSNAWEMMLFLPLQRFQKKSARAVWADA